MKIVKLSTNKKILLTVSVLLLCLIFFVAAYLRLAYFTPLNDELLKYVWRDPQSVGTAFAVALMENEEDVLREVVVAEELWKIDIWLTDHEAVHCDISPEGGSVVGYPRPDERNRFTGYGVVIELFCSRYSEDFYLLSIENMLLEDRGENWPKWQIVAWEVCERRKSDAWC